MPQHHAAEAERNTEQAATHCRQAAALYKLCQASCCNVVALQSQSPAEAVAHSRAAAAAGKSALHGTTATYWALCWSGMQHHCWCRPRAYMRLLAVPTSFQRPSPKPMRCRFNASRSDCFQAIRRLCIVSTVVHSSRKNGKPRK